MKRTVLLFVLVCILAMPGYAFAYLDAGSGSMLVQLLLGGVAGLAVFLKVSWKWILEKVGIRHRETNND